MNYRRAKIQGGMFFFTVVTFNRNKIFIGEASINTLRKSFKMAMEKHPFIIDAIVVLPEHIHCIWTLPDGDNDYSTRWMLIKSNFTRMCDKSLKTQVDGSRIAKKEQKVWQRRFWEHAIRDDNDFIRHVEYIHYNPVKHGLVISPADWPYSSFNRYVENGLYDKDWGSGKIIEFQDGIGKE